MSDAYDDSWKRPGYLDDIEDRAEVLREEQP